ncbi:MAG: hypothetical protein WC462_00085 [archaeon]
MVRSSKHKTKRRLPAWAKLKPRQKVERIRALSVLNKVRNKYSLTRACKEFGITKESAVKQLGRALFKRKGRWVARKTDSIQREMRIYSQGKIKSIIVRNSKDASIIGKYYSAVKNFLKTRSTKELRKFKRIKIKDAKRKKHTLETLPQKILDIEEQKENPEFYEIYEADEYA